MIELPPLPYPEDALAPHISAETVHYHYGKHHRAYVNNLNTLIAGTEFEKMDLESIIRKSSGKVFNNAAQVWNHTFYWNCLAPHAPREPQGTLAEALRAQFGSMTDFQQQFSTCAVGAFGSGWAWLVRKPSGALEIRSTSNAEPAFLNGDVPLLTCDVWEHAYYIDYRNDRAAHVKAFWNVVDWAAVSDRFSAPGA